MSYFAVTSLSKIQILSGDFEGTLKMVHRVLSIKPDDVNMAYFEAFLEYAISGDSEAYSNALTSLPIITEGNVETHWHAAFNSRDYTKALSTLETNPFDAIINSYVYLPACTS